MNILILGCGYIGLAAAAQWVKKGHRVTATTRSPEKALELKAYVQRVILLSSTPLEILVESLKETDVLLIAVAPGAGEDYQKTYLATAELIQRALKGRIRPLHILYTSSTSVYGDHAGAQVNEISAPQQPTPQAEILLATEHKLGELSHENCQVTVFRLGEIYGPSRSIGDRLKRLAGKTLPGDGSSITNLIHRDEVSQALDFALENQLAGVFNLCNDIHQTRRSLYADLCQKLNLEHPLWDVTLKSPHGGNKIVANDKIKHYGFKFLNLCPE